MEKQLSLVLTSSQGQTNTTTNTIEILRIISQYYEQLYTNELGQLEEVAKFLVIQSSRRE